jgi:hypothetical protein
MIQTIKCSVKLMEKLHEPTEKLVKLTSEETQKVVDEVHHVSSLEQKY